MQPKDLLTAACKAQEMAYAPYSHYRVGAALLTTGGKLFTGANIENASYSMTICAERVAVVGAVMAGETEFEALAVASSGSERVMPCGACLQVLAEFAPGIRIITSDAKGELKEYSLKDLLPCAFTWQAK